MDTICLHQTHVSGGFGVSKRQLRAAAGDHRVALHNRFRKVPYHVIALRNGDVLVNNRVDAYTYHGNRSNSFSLGVAVDGKWPGDEWTDAIESTLHTALDAALHIATMARTKIQWITPHGTWSRARRMDPGLQIWDSAMRWCEDNGITVSVRGPAGGGKLPHELRKYWMQKA